MVKLSSEVRNEQEFQRQKNLSPALCLTLWCTVVVGRFNFQASHPYKSSWTTAPQLLLLGWFSSAAGICQGMRVEIRMDKNFPVVFRCWSRVGIREEPKPNRALPAPSPQCVTRAVWWKDHGFRPALPLSAQLTPLTALRIQPLLGFLLLKDLHLV